MRLCLQFLPQATISQGQTQVGLSQKDRIAIHNELLNVKGPTTRNTAIFKRGTQPKKQQHTFSENVDKVLAI